MIILQNDDGGCADQLKVTRSWHAEYAKYHGYEYVVMCEKAPVGMSPHWGKVVALKKLLRSLDKNSVFWIIDCDAVIKKARKEDKLDGVLLPEKEFALVKSLPILNAKFNSGVMPIRVTDMMIDFFDQVLKLGQIPNNKTPGEQARIIDLLLKTPKLNFQELDSKYNNYMGSKYVKTPVIRAFHGEGDRSKIPNLLTLAMNIEDF